jgi:hypothetical protein
MFFSCPLAQQVWRYAANIIWPLFAKFKGVNLILENIFHIAMPI